MTNLARIWDTISPTAVDHQLTQDIREKIASGDATLPVCAGLESSGESDDRREDLGYRKLCDRVPLQSVVADLME